MSIIYNNEIIWNKEGGGIYGKKERINKIAYSQGSDLETDRRIESYRYRRL